MSQNENLLGALWNSSTHRQAKPSLGKSRSATPKLTRDSLLILFFSEQN